MSLGSAAAFMITVLIVIHELNNAIKFADHIVGMKAGELIFHGALTDVITVENLRTLYSIDAKLQMDETNTYPVCVNYDLVTD